jgi:hypothetical protein
VLRHLHICICVSMCTFVPAKQATATHMYMRQYLYFCTSKARYSVATPTYMHMRQYVYSCTSKASDTYIYSICVSICTFIPIKQDTVLRHLHICICVSMCTFVPAKQATPTYMYMRQYLFFFTSKARYSVATPTYMYMRQYLYFCTSKASKVSTER